MTAELAEANGLPTYALCGGAIHRLVAFVVDEIRDPAAIQAMTGQAQLVNRSFTGTDGPAPYRLHVEITCMKRYDNRVVLGGTTKSTNDLGLIDAVFFTVEDNGEPGAGVDEISRTYFWDDIPGTTGDPQACELNGPQDFPTEPIEGGNIQVR